MIPKLIKGRGIKGVALYVLFDKREVADSPKSDGPADGRPDIMDEIAADRAQTSARVGFVATRNMSTDDPHEAWRMMCQTAILQDELRRLAGIRAGGRKTENHVAHLSLSWHPDENPDRQEMERAADSVLRVMGYDHLEAFMVEHTDEAHKHMHIVVCMIDPENGRAAPNRHNEIKNILEPWALAYERERGRIFCEKRLENEAAREAGEKGGRYPTKTHRKDWRLGRDIAAAFAKENAAHEANDNSTPTPSAPQTLAERQKAERDALYHQAKADAKELTAKVREAFKPQWADLYRDHKRVAEELKSIRKGRDRGPALARFVNAHRDTLMKAFKDTAEANKYWPDLVKGRDLPQTLAAGQQAEKAELSGRHNGVRQDAQKRFWDRYGAAIETMRTQQAYERTEAKRIAKEQAVHEAKPVLVADEFASRAERAAAARDADKRAATLQAAQRMAEQAQQNAADAAKVLAEAKVQEAWRAKEEAEGVEKERAKSKGAPSEPSPKVKVQVRFDMGPQPSPHPSFAPSPAADLRERAIFKPAQAAQEPKPERTPEMQKRMDAQIEADRLKAALEKITRDYAAAEARRRGKTRSRGHERER